MSYSRYFSLLVSNTYCVVFLLCFSSSCVPYVASFSGFSLNMWKSKRKSQHGTQNVDTHNRTTQKTKKMSNTDPTNKPGVNSCAREGYAVPASYKTPVMVLTYSIQVGHVTVASFMILLCDFGTIPTM
jgi:hypothetical protein